MLGMQVAYAIAGAAARITRFGFPVAESVLSSIVTGTIVFWIWVATTSPVQSATAQRPPHARTTQQNVKEEASQPAASPSSFISQARCSAEPVQQAASVEHAPGKACDASGLEDEFLDGMDAYVSPLGSRLRVSADSEPGR
jgi:hypothetical protein